MRFFDLENMLAVFLLAAIGVVIALTLKHFKDDKVVKDTPPNYFERMEYKLDEIHFENEHIIELLEKRCE